MDTKELLKKVHRIQIVTNRMVDEILAGEYNSAFKGREWNLTRCGSIKSETISDH